jgi:hypothetical protein
MKGMMLKYKCGKREVYPEIKKSAKRDILVR